MIDEGEVLAQLLAPLSVDAWLKKYWNRRAIHIKGQRDKFAMLAFSEAAMYRAIEKSHGRGGFKVGYVEAGQHRERAPHSRQARALYAAGKTLCLDLTHRHHAPLGRIAAAVQLGAGALPEVAVSAYMSPDGSGFGLHFDDRPVLILQIEGAKEWRHSAVPGVRAPVMNVVAGVDEAEFAERCPWERLVVPTERSLARCTLQPGDALFLPAGTWHRTRGKGHSLALTLRFPRVDARALVGRLLQQRLAGSEQWRMNVPLSPAVEGLEETVPRHLLEFWRQRLDELARVVAKLTPNDLHRMWLALSQRHPTAERPAQSKLRKTDRLRARRGLRCTRVGDEICCYSPDGEVRMPRTALPFLRDLCRRQSFVAAASTTFGGETHAWSEVAALLQTLLDHGLVMRDLR